MPLRWDASDEEVRARYWNLRENCDAMQNITVPVTQLARELAAASVAHALHEQAPMTREALADFLMHDQPSSYQFFLGKPGAVGRDYCLNVADAILAHFSPAALHERDGASSGEQDQEALISLLIPLFPDYTDDSNLGDHAAMLAEAILAAGFRRSPVQERGVDTERLDWLEAQANGWQGVQVCRLQIDNEDMEVAWNDGLTPARRTARNVREAIDAARSASPPAGETT